MCRVRKCLREWRRSGVRNPQVPYMTDKNGNFVLGFENVKSVTAKCHYIIEHDLRGAMYWEYADDYEQGDLRTAVAQCLLPNEQQGTRGKKESQ